MSRQATPAPKPPTPGPAPPPPAESNFLSVKPLNSLSVISTHPGKRSEEEASWKRMTATAASRGHLLSSS